MPMFTRYLFSIVALFLITAMVPLSAHGQELPEGFAALVEKLASTSDKSERAKLLQKLSEKIRNSGQDDSKVTGVLISKVATNVGALAELQKGMDRLRKRGILDSPETYAQSLLPILQAVGSIIEKNAPEADAVARFNASLKELDKTAQELNLPKLSDLIKEYGGSKAAGLLKTLSIIETIAVIGEDWGTKETKEHLNARANELTSIFPPTYAAPLLPLVRAEIVWTRQMFDASTRGLGLVSQAIHDGRFDEKAYEKVEADLHRLQKGPWDDAILREIVLEICGKVPGLGPHCKELLGFVFPDKKGLPQACVPIDCKCDAIDAGLLTGPWRAQCREVQADILARCIKEEVLKGECFPAGDGAIP